MAIISERIRKGNAPVLARWARRAWRIRAGPMDVATATLAGLALLATLAGLALLATLAALWAGWT